MVFLCVLFCCFVVSFWLRQRQRASKSNKSYNPKQPASKQSAHNLKFNADPATVATGGTSAITSLASDPDGDTLTYAWSADGGVITGSGSTVVWTAPATVGTYAITCKVSDGKLESSMQVSVSVEKVETVNTWKITGFNEISTVLVSGENIILVGESDSAQKGLKVQKRSLADPDTIIWTYENNDGVICKASWNPYVNNKCKGAISPDDGNIYAFGVSETPWESPGFAITDYDLAWRVLKINSSGELVWDQKSDQIYHDVKGEYPIEIAISGEEVYVVGDHGVIMPDRTRRLEKYNGLTGELIWSSKNSYIWPEGLAINGDKSYVVGGANSWTEDLGPMGFIS